MLGLEIASRSARTISTPRLRARARSLRMALRLREASAPGNRRSRRSRGSANGTAGSCAREASRRAEPAATRPRCENVDVQAERRRCCSRSCQPPLSSAARASASSGAGEQPRPGHRRERARRPGAWGSSGRRRARRRAPRHGRRRIRPGCGLEVGRQRRDDGAVDAATDAAASSRCRGRPSPKSSSALGSGG